MVEMTGQVRLLYQRLKDWMESTEVDVGEEYFDLFTELHQSAVEGGVFQPKDIPELCTFLYETERKLNDVDWSIKDDIVTIIVELMKGDGVLKWIDTLTESIDLYAQLPGEYPSFLVEQWIFIFLFVDLEQDESGKWDERVRFLDSMKRNVRDWRKILMGFCKSSRKNDFVDSWYSTDEEKEVVHGLLKFLKKHGDRIMSFAECDALRN